MAGVELQVDEDRRGRLSSVETMIALRALNNKLSDFEEEYIYRVSDCTTVHGHQGVVIYYTATYIVLIKTCKLASEEICTAWP